MPTSPTHYKREENKSKQGDIFRERKISTSKELTEKRREKIILWNTFFRRNPNRLVSSYFGIKLYPYQKLLIWMLQRSKLAYIVASRATAKSFIIGLWAVVLCVLYPNIIVVIASKTLSQSGNVIKEKIKYFYDNYPNVRREIYSITTNPNVYEVVFHNGSVIRAVVSNENSRSKRCNYLILDESRIVPKEILDSVLIPFLFQRMPPYRLLPEYEKDERLKENGIISYITSCGWKQEFWFEMVKKTIKRMLSGDETSNFIALDYLLTIFHNIKSKEMIENETADMDDIVVQTEYHNIPAGSSGKSYYKSNMFPRNIKRAFYPQRIENYNAKKNPYDFKKVEGEVRILSIDVSTRANKNNDQSANGIIRLIPTQKGYERHLVYIEVAKGQSTVLQALNIKRLWDDAQIDYIVLDLQQAGIAVYDSLTQTTVDDVRGKTYDGFTVFPHISLDEKLVDELRERTLSVNAKPIIYPILASQRLNNDIAVSFRTSLQKKMWNFLCSDSQAEEYLIKNSKEFVSIMDDPATKAFFLAPYVNSDFLVSECINLELNLVNGIIKLTEPSGGLKDRYSMISYANWFVSLLDKELIKEKDNTSDEDAILSVTMVV
jgi:hypothetical protein